MTTTRSVVVLGMHRSGTSVVAGILHALGVNMGPSDAAEGWTGRHWSNPTGHFENRAFVDLDLRMLGGDATGLRGPPRWEDLPMRAEQFRPEIERLLAVSEAPLWGWKDPWTVLTLPAFLPLLHAPSFVIVRRSWDEILASLKKRAGPEDELIASLLATFERRLDELERSLAPRPVLTIDYAEVLADPRTVIDKLVRFLALTPTREELERAFGMVLRGAALHAEQRRLATSGLVGFPRWAGWIVKRDLRANPRVLAADLRGAIPRELLQVLRALL